MQNEKLKRMTRIQLEIERIKQKEKERQIEVDRVHLADEEKEKDRPFEFVKHKFEMEKLGVQQRLQEQGARVKSESDKTCLLYTSDAADE